MNQDDVEYVLELLEDAITEQDWDLIEEAYQYLCDFSKNPKYSDEE
jgi:hypothetical protein